MSATTFPTRIHFFILLLLFICGQLTAAIVVIALSAIVGNPPGGGVPDWSIPLLGILGTGPAVVYAWRQAGKPRMKLRAAEVSSARTLFPILLATLLISFGVGALTGYLPTSEYMPQIGESLTPGVGMFIGVVLIAPLVEEVLCRGILLSSLLKTRSPRTSILLSALFFGILHLNPAHVVAASALGLVLGYVYYRTRSLTLVVILHGFNNLVAYLGGVARLGDETMQELSGAAVVVPSAIVAGFVGWRILVWALDKHYSSTTDAKQDSPSELAPVPVRVE